MPGRALILWDDNMTTNRDYAGELFKALGPLKRWWTSQATADIADDEELLRLAAQSGCKALSWGWKVSRRRVSTAQINPTTAPKIMPKPCAVFTTSVSPSKLARCLVLTMTTAVSSNARWTR